MEKLNTLFSALAWSSYAANRDYGMTHEQLISIGIGNDAMRDKYDAEGAPTEPQVFDLTSMD